MKLDHIAVWTNDLERLRDFYERYFDARAGDRYESTNHPGFSSYFLTFAEGASRLELMTIPGLAVAGDRPALGYPHVAIGVGSRAAVDALVGRMASERVPIATAPHVTGDGYYEAVVQDPDGNLVEITA